MIYDCIIFYNELDLLELRLETLDSTVDMFVLVEGTKTFSNVDKPLYYRENKERFAKWNDKIIHVAVDTYPEHKTSWTYENHLRNSILTGLKFCNDDDIIIISDVDEIPRPTAIIDAVNILKSDSNITILGLEMNMYYYYLNYQNMTAPHWSLARIVRYDAFDKDLPCDYSHVLIKELNETTTPHKIRSITPKMIIKNGGWHFSYIGGIDRIINKVQTFSHQQYNDKKYLNRDHLQKCIYEGKDLFGRGDCFSTIVVDKTFPTPIVNNINKYESLICHFPKQKWLHLKVIFVRFKRKIADLRQIICTIG